MEFEQDENYDLIHSKTKLDNVKNKLDNVKEVMVNTIDNVLERGSKLEVLVDKTDELQSASINFKYNARNLRRAMLCKKIKTYCAIFLSIIFIIWLFSSVICGFDYKKCSD